MKRTYLVMIAIFVIGSSVLGAQERLVLISGGYIENHHKYDYENGPTGGLPAEDFSDTWRSWSLGTTQFVPGKGVAGFYSSSLVFFPEQLVRSQAGGSSSNDFREFRIGLNSLTGVGAFLGSGRLRFLLGGGIHTDFVYMNKYPGTVDSNYFFWNIGLGGGVHLHFALNEKIGLHAGTTWWWDPFQVRSSSYNAISNAYTFATGWGYNVTAGISIKAQAKRRRGMH